MKNQSQDPGNNTLTETVNPSKKSDSESDQEHLKNKFVSKSSDTGSDSDVIRKPKKRLPSGDNDAPAPVQKSSGKFSLITESDLESENDRPMNRLSSDDDLSSRSKKKTKKLQKKKSSVSTKFFSNLSNFQFY